MQHVVGGTGHCRLAVQDLFVHLLLEPKVRMHDVVEGLLQMSHLPLERITTFNSSGVLVLRYIEVTWHCQVIFEQSGGLDIATTGFESIAVDIELVNVPLDYIVPSVTFHLASAGFLFIKVL